MRHIADWWLIWRCGGGVHTFTGMVAYYRARYRVMRGDRSAHICG